MIIINCLITSCAIQFKCGLFHVPPTATLDGGMGLLLPMQEKTYRRLLMLQNALTTMLPHHAGLNPKAFRFGSVLHSLFTMKNFYVRLYSTVKRQL